MKMYVLLLALVGMIFVFPSCNDGLVNGEEFDRIDYGSKILSRSVDNDSIILPFNEEDFPEIARKTRSVDSDLEEELTELVGIPFRIRSVNVGNLNTLQTNGKGKELLLRAYDEGNTNQLFRLLSLPMESGIPYMIYSNKENVPIGIGSYSSDPETPVLYAKADDSGSTWGFGWNIYNTSDNNAFVMENVDYYTTNNSSLTTPITYYSIAASSGGDLSLEATTKGLSQQFVYIPEGVWNIVSIEMDTENASIVSTIDVDLQSRQYTNRTEEILTCHFSVNKEFTDSIYFNENKRITTTKNVSPKLSIKLLKILTTSLGFEFGTEEIVEVQYANSSCKKTIITDDITFDVPAYTIKVVDYKSYRHKVRIPYSLNLVNGDGMTLKIKGVYEDTSYSEMDIEVSSFPLNIPSNRMFSNELELIHKETIKSENFSVTSVFEP